MNTFRRSLFTLGVASALAWPVVAAAQDADRDGVADAADAFPCDGGRASVTFFPSEGQSTLVSYEDQWPGITDLDFNDVAVRVNYRIERDAAGNAVSVLATIDPVALGGLFSNGLALQLPAPRDGVTVERRVDGGEWTALPLEPDASATAILSPNLRELYGDAEGRINSEVGEEVLEGDRLEVRFAFSAPAPLPTAEAPFDLFVFRAGDFGHQIHFPQYAGTVAMNTALFGSAQDASDASRRFVHLSGVPAALNLLTTARYPQEGVRISDLFPDIVEFARSRGTRSADFYVTNVVAARGHGVSPRALPPLGAPDAACVEAPATCSDGRMNGDEAGKDCGGASCRACFSVADDAVAAFEGETVSIAAAVLTANDYSVDGALTVVAVDAPFGGAVSLSGSTITFRSTGTAGQPAGFRYTARNALGETLSASVVVTVSLPEIAAIMVDTAADLEALTSPAGGYTPPSASEIFSTWYRFSHAATVRAWPCVGGCGGETASWRYVASSDLVESTVNSSTFIGFVSPEPLVNYSLQTRLTSTNADNDVIAVVIALAVDADGRQHTLSALRGRSNQAGVDVGTTDAYWVIAYNYNQPDEQLIANGNSTLGVTTANWSGASLGTTVRIERRGDLVTATASSWNTTALVAGSALTVDLGADPLLHRFRGPQHWGFGALSQQNARFTHRVITGGFNGSVVYDASVNPGRVFDFNSGTGTWGVRPGATPQSVLGCPRSISRPSITSVQPSIGPMNFLMTCESITRR